MLIGEKALGVLSDADFVDGSSDSFVQSPVKLRRPVSELLGAQIGELVFILLIPYRSIEYEERGNVEKRRAERYFTFFYFCWKLYRSLHFLQMSE